MILNSEYLATYSEQIKVGRLLLALYDVYGATSPEVEQHANYKAPLFEDNVIYCDKKERNTVYIVKVNGQLIAAENREDLQYVPLPNGEDNPLEGVDY